MPGQKYYPNKHVSCFFFLSHCVRILHKISINSVSLDGKLFKERRKESKELLEIIKNEGAYERKYKLLEGAYQKLLNVSHTTIITKNQ